MEGSERTSKRINLMLMEAAARQEAKKRQAEQQKRTRAIENLEHPVGGGQGTLLLENFLEDPRQQRFGGVPMKLAEISDGAALAVARALPKVLHGVLKRTVKNLREEAIKRLELKFQGERLLLQQLYGPDRKMSALLAKFLDEHQELVAALIEAIPKWEKASNEQKESEPPGSAATAFQIADLFVTRPFKRMIQKLGIEPEPGAAGKEKKSLIDMTDGEIIHAEPSGEDVLQDQKLGNLVSTPEGVDRYIKRIYNVNENEPISKELMEAITENFQIANRVHEKRIRHLYSEDEAAGEKLQWLKEVQDANSYKEIWKLLHTPPRHYKKEKTKKRLRKELMLKLGYCTIIGRAKNLREYIARKPIAGYLNELILREHVKKGKYQCMDLYFEIVKENGEEKIRMLETEEHHGMEKIRVVKVELMGTDMVTEEQLGPITMYFYQGRDENDKPPKPPDEKTFDVVNIKSLEVITLKTLFKELDHPAEVVDIHRVTGIVAEGDFETAKRILENGILFKPNAVEGKDKKNRVTRSIYDKNVEHTTVEIAVKQGRFKGACKRHGIKKPQYLGSVKLEMRLAKLGILLERCPNTWANHDLYKKIQMVNESRKSMPRELYDDEDHWLLRLYETLRAAYYRYEIDESNVLSRAMGIVLTEGMDGVVGHLNPKIGEQIQQVKSAMMRIRKAFTKALGLDLIDPDAERALDEMTLH